jgi:hydroxyethylthiazole kinase
MIDQKKLIEDLQKVRESAPLIHNITNYVVMNSTANTLLSLGASPVMAHAKEEMEDMVSIASALVINIGTLSKHWIEAMNIAGKAASEKGKPIVLDPVGAGATKLRTDTAHEIIENVKPRVIRGNASEILAIVQAEMKTKGVDSTASPEEAIEIAKELAEKTGAVISISGKTDYITDGKTVHEVSNGHPLMGKITGTGCAASAVTGAFAAVNSDYLTASTEAMLIMGIAGEMAGEEADAPGTFQARFLDALYKIDEKEIRKRMKG